MADSNWENLKMKVRETKDVTSLVRVQFILLQLVKARTAHTRFKLFHRDVDKCVYTNAAFGIAHRMDAGRTRLTTEVLPNLCKRVSVLFYGRSWSNNTSEETFTMLFCRYIQLKQLDKMRGVQSVTVVTFTCPSERQKVVDCPVHGLCASLQGRMHAYI